MNFGIHFLIIFISKINDHSSGEIITFIQFHCVNVKGNWAHLAEKNSRSCANVTITFSLS